MKKTFLVCAVSLLAFATLADSKDDKSASGDCSCCKRYDVLSKKEKLTSDEKKELEDVKKCPCVEEMLDNQKDKKDSDKKDSEESSKNDDEEKSEEMKKDYDESRSKKRKGFKKDRGEDDDSDVKKSKDDEKKDDEKKDKKKDDKKEDSKSSSSKKSKKERKSAFNYEGIMSAKQLEDLVKRMSNYGTLVADASKQTEKHQEENEQLLKKYRVSKTTSKRLSKELEQYRKLYS